jgi:hypothetical protein
MSTTQSWFGQVVLAHETADPLGIDDYAVTAQFGANPAIAIGFELIADRYHVATNAPSSVDNGGTS